MSGDGFGLNHSFQDLDSHYEGFPNGQGALAKPAACLCVRTEEAFGSLTPLLGVFAAKEPEAT